MTEIDRTFVAKSICLAAGAIIATIPGINPEDGGAVVQSLTSQIIEIMKEANESNK